METSTAPTTYEQVAFFGGLTTLKATNENTGGALFLIENVAPRGVGSPLHIHHHEDEWFYVLDGELTVWVDGRVVTIGPGDFAFGPRGLPHTFIVSSDEARFLLGTMPGDFEGFVRALAAPVETLKDGPAGPPDMELVAAAAARYGIDIIGPPGIPA